MDCHGGATPTTAPEELPAAVIHFKDDNLLTVDTHPHTDLIACGTVQGEVSLYNFENPDSLQHMSKSRITKESCRSVRFSKSGKYLYCGCKDKSLHAIDVVTQNRIRQYKNSHDSPLNALHTVSERLVASGDENGCIKVWDTRVQKEVLSVAENTDFISDMVSKDHTLLCTSGDGSLAALDLRQHKMEERSDCSESELLCLSLVKGGTRVVTGNGEGVLGIFMWDLWGDIVDRYPVTAPSDSIDSLIQVSDSVVCVGGMDGKLRAIQILPNKVIGEVGQHSSEYAVDCLCLNSNKQYLLSSSYDCIKLWPVDRIPTVFVEEGETRENRQKRRKRKGQKMLLQPDKKLSRDNSFFADL